jgi:hypothetical protein
MSLISTFYVGDSEMIEGAICRGDFDFLESSGVAVVDFSGGVSGGYLFPEDFLALTAGGGGSIWRLRRKNLVEGEEQGLYLLSDADVDDLVSLDEQGLSDFSTRWNRDRSEGAAAGRRRHSIWRNSAYWRIFAGGSIGLLFGYLMDRSSLGVLWVLFAWIAGMLGLAALMGHRRASRLENREPFQAVDWVGPLKELQIQLRKASEAGESVCYYWAL